MRDETQGSKPLGFIEKGSPWMKNFQTHPTGQTRPRRLGESSGCGPRATARLEGQLTDGYTAHGPEYAPLLLCKVRDCA
jgi:hypothetical protein